MLILRNRTLFLRTKWQLKLEPYTISYVLQSQHGIWTTNPFKGNSVRKDSRPNQGRPDEGTTELGHDSDPHTVSLPGYMSYLQSSNYKNNTYFGAYSM